MSPRNPIIFGLKGQRSTSQRRCWSSDRTQYCRWCCIRKLLWVFPAAVPRRTSAASDTGFSLRCFPASACRWTLGFPGLFFLHSCECRLLLVSASLFTPAPRRPTAECWSYSLRSYQWRCTYTSSGGRCCCVFIQIYISYIDRHRYWYCNAQVDLIYRLVWLGTASILFTLL